MKQYIPRLYKSGPCWLRQGLGGTWESYSSEQGWYKSGWQELYPPKNYALVGRYVVFK